MSLSLSEIGIDVVGHLIHIQEQQEYSGSKTDVDTKGYRLNASLSH